MQPARFVGHSFQQNLSTYITVGTGSGILLLLMVLSVLFHRQILKYLPVLDILTLQHMQRDRGPFMIRSVSVLLANLCSVACESVPQRL